jgi:hypothetical protein
MFNDTGYVYIANGEEFRWLASLSIKSLLKFTEPSNIQLFCDQIDSNIQPYESMVTLLPEEYLSDKRIIKKASKIYGMMNAKFDKVIYLDCDTFIVNSLEPCFDILFYSNIAMAKDLHGAVLEFQDLKYFLNTGVVVYNKNSVYELFKEWLKEFNCTDGSSDQKVLMDLIHKYSIQSQVYILPDTFNFRAGIKSVLSGKLHVLHKYQDINGLSNNYLSEFINKSTGYRIFDPETLSLEIFDNGVFIKESYVERDN